jgi:hypothetical protein
VGDVDLLLDIPDDIPPWLGSEEWQLSQAANEGGFGILPSPAVSAISSRRSALINLPSNRGSSISGLSSNDDDFMYSDILEVRNFANPIPASSRPNDPNCVVVMRPTALWKQPFQTEPATNNLNCSANAGAWW